MSTSDESRGRQQGGGSSQASTQQGTTQQGGSSSSPSSAQQEQFSPSSAQQGGSNLPQQGGSNLPQQGSSPLARRGGSGFAPSLWSGRGGPFELMHRLEDDMDRLFQQVWGGGRRLMRGRGSEAAQMWVPAVEIYERGGKLHVHADLPGMRKEDVKLSVEADQLVLQGERRSSHEESDQQSGYYHSECSYGSFYRAIPLPEGIDPATADANFKDGILDVSFDAPKKQQEQSRQIKINVK